MRFNINHSTDDEKEFRSMMDIIRHYETEEMLKRRSENEMD